MQTSQNNTAQSRRYKGFSFRQRLIPTILASLAVSLTVFIFGSFDIYSANANQFGFSLFDFIGWNLLFALGLTAIICAILLPLRGRAFDVVFAFFFWLALMLIFVFSFRLLLFFLLVFHHGVLAFLRQFFYFYQPYFHCEAFLFVPVFQL